MIVGILEVSFHIPGSQSLKDKRQVVRGLKDRIRRRFNVSLAETDGQETWRQCSLAAAMVATQRTAVERDLNRILDLIQSVPAVEVTDQWIEYL